MNNTIKYLESLGQNASIKQFDSLDEMINKMEKNEGVMANSISSDNDLVCGLLTHNGNDQICGLLTHNGNDQALLLVAHNDQVPALLAHNDQVPALFTHN